MAAYYEEKVNFSRESVIVCVPHDLFNEFLQAVKEYNDDMLRHHDRIGCTVEHLRPSVKRLTKCAISYQDFRGAYF